MLFVCFELTWSKEIRAIKVVAYPSDIDKVMGTELDDVSKDDHNDEIDEPREYVLFGLFWIDRYVGNDVTYEMIRSTHNVIIKKEYSESENDVHAES